MAVLNRVRLPEVPHTPSLSSPQLDLTLTPSPPSLYEAMAHLRPLTTSRSAVQRRLMETRHCCLGEGHGLDHRAMGATSHGGCARTPPCSSCPLSGQPRAFHSVRIPSSGMRRETTTSPRRCRPVKPRTCCRTPRCEPTVMRPCRGPSARGQRKGASRGARGPRRRASCGTRASNTHTRV